LPDEPSAHRLPAPSPPRAEPALADASDLRLTGDLPFRVPLLDFVPLGAVTGANPTASQRVDEAEGVHEQDGRQVDHVPTLPDADRSGQPLKRR